MIRTIYKKEDENFEWIDVIDPQKEDYDALIKSHDIHPSAVKDCMSSMHLPKIEQFDDTVFIISRVFDEGAATDADTIQQLTNKVAMFISKKFVITIHRQEEPFLTKIIDRWKNADPKDKAFTNSSYLINKILHKVIHTFDSAVHRASERCDDMEKRIFKGTKDPQIIMNMYIVKRRASVFKRILFLTKDFIEKFTKYNPDGDAHFLHDLIENANTGLFLADELHENVNNLLNLHISLSSHRTDSIMGWLTIFSTIFLPLTFVTGLYGMNFDNMPELHWKYGYFSVLFMMISISISTFYWFKKRGWL